MGRNGSNGDFNISPDSRPTLYCAFPDIPRMGFRSHSFVSLYSVEIQIIIPHLVCGGQGNEAEEYDCHYHFAHIVGGLTQKSVFGSLIQYKLHIEKLAEWLEDLGSKGLPGTAAPLLREKKKLIQIPLLNHTLKEPDPLFLSVLTTDHRMDFH